MGHPRTESLWRPVIVAALLSLGITVLRLIGELWEWTPRLFDRSSGGGGSPLGIIWLVPILGAYFGHRLAPHGFPDRLGRSFAAGLGALLVLVAFLGLGFSLPTASLLQFLSIGAGSWLAIGVAWPAWPTLARALLAYGLLARIPVALVVLGAVMGEWGTHYDSPPPGLPEMGPGARWVATGLIPQLTLWLAITVVVGLLAGLAAGAGRGRRLGA